MDKLILKEETDSLEYNYKKIEELLATEIVVEDSQQTECIKEGYQRNAAVQRILDSQDKRINAYTIDKQGLIVFN